MEPEPRGGERVVAGSFYLALMTATCLRLIGAQGDIVVEGPLGANRPFLSMLAQATGRQVFVPGEGNVTGTSVGAALLCGGATVPSSRVTTRPPLRSRTNASSPTLRCGANVPAEKT